MVVQQSADGLANDAERQPKEHVSNDLIFCALFEERCNKHHGQLSHHSAKGPVPPHAKWHSNSHLVQCPRHKEHHHSSQGLVSRYTSSECQRPISRWLQRAACDRYCNNPAQQTHGIRLGGELTGGDHGPIHTTDHPLVHWHVPEPPVLTNCAGVPPVLVEFSVGKEG